jgi:hypothetical protein
MPNLRRRNDDKFAEVRRIFLGEPGHDTPSRVTRFTSGQRDFHDPR